MPAPAPRHFSMIRNFHLADFFTLGNGCCGTAAIFLAMDHLREAGAGKIYLAGFLVLAALFLDVMDGRIARWRHAASPMGRELDSLADVISFGVAPACVAYAVGMNAFLDAVALLYFAACGISRLARYNITAEDIAGSSGKVRYFEGTPIPSSLVLVALLALCFYFERTGEHLPIGRVEIASIGFHPFALLFFANGCTMISKTLKIPKL